MTNPYAWRMRSSPLLLTAAHLITPPCPPAGCHTAFRWVCKAHLQSHTHINWWVHVMSMHQGHAEYHDEVVLTALNTFPGHMSSPGSCRPPDKIRPHSKRSARLVFMTCVCSPMIRSTRLACVMKHVHPSCSGGSRLIFSMNLRSDVVTCAQAHTFVPCNMAWCCIR